MSTATAATIHRNRSRHTRSAPLRPRAVALRSGPLPGLSGALPEAAPSEPVDRTVFGVLVDLEKAGPAFLGELIAEFDQSVERKLHALHAAVRDGDTDALVFAAHGLRGSCGTIGARRMAALATCLEERTPDEAEQRSAVVGWIEAEAAVVREWIAAERARIGLGEAPELSAAAG